MGPYLGALCAASGIFVPGFRLSPDASQQVCALWHIPWALGKVSEKYFCWRYHLSRQGPEDPIEPSLCSPGCSIQLNYYHLQGKIISSVKTVLGSGGVSTPSLLNLVIVLRSKKKISLFLGETRKLYPPAQKNGDTYRPPRLSSPWLSPTGQALWVPMLLPQPGKGNSPTGTMGFEGHKDLVSKSAVQSGSPYMGLWRTPMR